MHGYCYHDIVYMPLAFWPLNFSNLCLSIYIVYVIYLENWGAEYPGHDVLGRPAPVKSLDEGSGRPDVVDRGRGGEGNGGGESKDNLVALAPSTFPQIRERFRQFIAQPGFFLAFNESSQVFSSSICQSPILEKQKQNLTFLPIIFFLQ